MRAIIDDLADISEGVKAILWLPVAQSETLG